METKVTIPYPDQATLDREAQLELSLDMKVKEIENLKYQIIEKDVEILAIEKRYESTIEILSMEISGQKLTIKTHLEKIISTKAKLDQANDTIDTFIDKMT